MKYVIGSKLYLLCTELFFSQIFTNWCKMKILIYSSIVWVNCIVNSEMTAQFTSA